MYEENENKKFNLDNLPFSSYYEKSYMHKEIVDNVVCATETDFIFTTSLDGILKFWKKNYIGIEFIKQYKAHSGKISGISVSNSGLYLTTCSNKDDSLKIFEVINFDMINYVSLKFSPLLCQFISKYNDPGLLIAVTEKENGNIHLVKGDSKGEIFKTIKIHEHPITAIRFNEPFSTVISVDNSGMIEYWDTDTYEIPKNVKFEYKSETSLYELVQNKVMCLSLTISKKGDYFAMFCKDRHFRIFKFQTGMLYKVYNESLKFYVENYQDILKNELTRMEKQEFDKRLSTEKEIDKMIEKYVELFPPLNIQFDETGHYIMYSSILGIKLVELHTNRLIKILGKSEISERFLTISLFQGKALRVSLKHCI